MKNFLSVLMAMLLLATFSCRQEQQNQEAYQNEVKQKIAELDKHFFEAWENEDLETVMTYLDDDFINMFSFGKPNNKEQCREAFQNVIDTYLVEDVEFESVELIVDRNYAIETSLFNQKWITNDNTDTIFFDMRAMTVFKKQENGDWKMFRLIGQQ